MGASIVKWTTPHPCLVLSEHGLILNTNFELCEETNHRHSKGIPIYNAKQFMMTKKKPQKNLHILEDGANGVQAGDIEQVIV